MAAISREVRPGSRFRPQDFYYGGELDEALLRTISEASESSSSDDSESDELDDDTALAIAIQESLESAKLEELQRSHGSSPLASSVSQSHIPFPTTSGSISATPENISVPRARPRQNYSHTPSVNSASSVAPSPRLSVSSTGSSSPQLPAETYSRSRSRSIKGSARSSRYINVDLDEVARMSRRTSMATATRMFRGNLSQRSRDGSQTRYASQSDSSPSKSSQSDLQTELSQYEKLFFPSRLPPCSRCGGQTSVVSSPHRDRARSSFKLHQCLHIVCSVPECGQAHCRGCLKPRRSRCSPRCSSSTDTSKLCPTVSCCDLVRVVGVFEILCWLEDIYLASFPSVSPSSSPKRTGTTMGSQWESRAENLFNLLHSLLSFPISDDEEKEQFWSFVAPLLEVSLLRHILATLLQNASVKLWVTQSDLYLSILQLLRTLTDSPERRVRALFMNSPSPSNRPHLASTPKPDYGISRWARERVDAHSKARSGPGSSRSHEKGQQVQRPSQSQTWPALQEPSQESLYSIIEGLDAHRMALIDMRNRIHFPPTVEKLWGLADGLMYLALQGLLWY
ncbi:hypothetical protein VKT23_012414 [Stygiomarasmius scandens]|uniref:Uncharacterized protein n=1 Tax=Marasmiellus scandens TaxID=2682957 RepID=A0ABR1J607_9AGAR